MNVARSGLKVLVADVLTSVIGLLGLAYFAQVLTAGELGAFFLFQALLGMLRIPADFGIRRAVVKRLSEGEDPGSYVSSAFLLKLLPLLLVAGGILLFAGVINDYVGADLAVLLAVVLVIQEFARLTMKILEGELRVGATAVPTIARKVAYIGLGVVLVWAGFGVIGLAYAYLSSWVVMLVWGLARCSRIFNRPSSDHATDLVAFSKYSFISSVGGYVYNWMDLLIIGLLLTGDHVGAYEVSWRVTVVAMWISRSIATTIFPQVSRWDAEEAQAKIEQLIPKAIGPGLFLSIPAFFGVVVLSEDILREVFGPEYTIAWLVLIILMFEKVLQTMHAILGRSLQAIDRPDLAARATVVAVVLNLVLNVALVWWIGFVGAAIATVISFVVNTLLHARYLSRYISVQLPYDVLGWSVGASAAMAVSVYFTRSVIEIETLPSLFVVIVLGVVVYVVFSMFCPPLRRLVQNIHGVIFRNKSAAS